MNAIALKLDTLIQGHKMTLYVKYLNCEITEWLKYAPFGLVFQLNLWVQDLFSVAAALKLHIVIQDHKMTFYDNSHKWSEFDWIMPLLVLTHSVLRLFYW